MLTALVIAAIEAPWPRHDAPAFARLDPAIVVSVSPVSESAACVPPETVPVRASTVAAFAEGSPEPVEIPFPAVAARAPPAVSFP